MLILSLLHWHLRIQREKSPKQKLFRTGSSVSSSSSFCRACSAWCAWSGFGACRGRRTWWSWPSFMIKHLLVKLGLVLLSRPLMKSFSGLQVLTSYPLSMLICINLTQNRSQANSHSLYNRRDAATVKALSIVKGAEFSLPVLARAKGENSVKKADVQLKIDISNWPSCFSDIPSYHRKIEPIAGTYGSG